MHRIARTAAVLAVAAALLAAGTAAADGHGGVVASASGGSHFTLEDVFGLETLELQTFTFNAKVFEDGSVQGHYTYRSFEGENPFNASGPVTCAVIVGNRAWIGGLIEQSNEPSLVGADMWFQVADHGEPGGGRDVTTLIGAGGPGTAQDYCDRAPEPRFPWVIEHGNIQVRDFRP